MIKYVINAKKWFDGAYGNTYHNVNIIDVKTNKEIFVSGLTYGYDEQYKQTAFDYLIKEKLIKKEDSKDFEKRNKLFCFNVSIVGRKKDLFN